MGCIVPFKSPKQKRFFGMCKGNPSAAKKKCPSKSVINEFFRADKTQKKRKKK